MLEYANHSGQGGRFECCREASASREFPKLLCPRSLWRPEGWRPRPELNRGTRFCRPLRNHSATWPQCCGYRHSAVIDKIILKPLPCPILKVSSRLVRRCYCVVFPGLSSGDQLLSSGGGDPVRLALPGCLAEPSGASAWRSPRRRAGCGARRARGPDYRSARSLKGLRYRALLLRASSAPSAAPNSLPSTLRTWSSAKSGSASSDENTGPTFVQDVAKSSSTSPPRKYSQLALPRGEDRFILITITHTSINNKYAKPVRVHGRENWIDFDQ